MASVGECKWVVKNLSAIGTVSSSCVLMLTICCCLVGELLTKCLLVSCNKFYHLTCFSIAKMMWKKLTEKDCRELKLTTVNGKKGTPGDQVRVLLFLQLASHLEEGPLIWMMPIKNLNMMMMLTFYLIMRCFLMLLQTEQTPMRQFYFVCL